MRRIVLLLLVLLLALMTCSGCTSRMEAWGGWSEAEWTNGEQSARWRARGPTVHSNSGNVEGLDTNPAPFRVDKDGISSTPRKMKFSSLGGSQTTWLILIGGVLVAAGVILGMYFKQVQLGLALGAAGVTLLAFAFYGWLALLGFVVVLGVLIYWAYSTGKLQSVLGIVVRGVEKAKSASLMATKSVTAEIGKEAKKAGAETAVRKAVDANKT